jgi:hypothetical protein
VSENSASLSGYNSHLLQNQIQESIPLAEDKLYKTEYIGSGTFIISKPKRKERKLRQSRVKNRRRGMRK